MREDSPESDATPLRKALDAEREARRSIDEARAEARNIVAEAQAQARAIGRRADDRIAWISRAARTGTERLLEQQQEAERRALEALATAPEDTDALDDAARAVARTLTRAAPDDATEGRGDG